jgi:Type II secretory pathway, component PulF
LSAELAASDERSALQQLALRGVTVLSLEDLGPLEAARNSGRIRVEERALALRQLAGLVSGGVALPEACVLLPRIVRIRASARSSKPW